MKKLTDIVAMVMAVCAIITGIKLHQQVHHLYIYNDVRLWDIHIAAGIIMILALIFHCLQHKFWFKNYTKIKLSRKGVTSLLFVFAIFVAISGIILALGSHSNFISIFHYISAIAFTLLAITHVVKRLKIFISLFR